MGSLSLATCRARVADCPHDVEGPVGRVCSCTLNSVSELQCLESQIAQCASQPPVLSEQKQLRFALHCVHKFVSTSTSVFDAASVADRAS